MEPLETVECPFCLDRMHIEDREGIVWLVCANGCATEIEAPVRKPAELETRAELEIRAEFEIKEALRARAAGR